MTWYEKQKEKARTKAIDWQVRNANVSHSYYYLWNISNYFTKLGRRFGLLKEFRENGII